jgi:CRISPR-associated endonuclease/helicase Cas3
VRFKKQSTPIKTTPALPWAQCFAKSTELGGVGISVANHCEIAGMLTEKLCALKQLEALLPNSAPFFVSAHDTGKVSPGFLKHCSNPALKTLLPELAAADSEAKGWERNHAEIGEAAFCSWSKNERHKNSDWMAWAEVIGAHHGSRKDPKQEGCDPYGGIDWANERKKLLEHLFEKFSNGLPELPPTPEQQKVLAGLTCVSDWIASNEEFFPNTTTASPSDATIQNALDECGWSSPKFKKGLSFQEVFPFSPNTMQEAFLNCIDHRGVYVLEAPMGQGKTEAALFAAYQLMESGQNSGLYFGLPTRLTSDRIHQRVEMFMDKILENPGFVKLVHGHAWMRSNAKEFGAGMSWFHPRKRALLAPFGVGTIDQALMSVLRVKHHFVRTFGLAGKVVILDEVHSYDAYTGTLLNELVKELLEIGCSVIILSATLTAQRRSEFFQGSETSAAYPLISTSTCTIAPPPPPDRGIKLRFFQSSEEASLIEQAALAAERGLCVLWICNTVANSQSIFARINAERKEDSFKTGLLHSRFPAFRRAKLEDDWMGSLGKDGTRPKGCILVATQVVEQSVDIDADLIITELAPTDMLLQRMGRLCRHDRKNRPDGSGQAWVYGPILSDFDDAAQFKEALGSTHYVYAPYVLWKTIQVWRNQTEVHLPGDIRQRLEATYAELDDLPEWVEELKTDLEAKRSELKGKALGLTKIFCGDDDEDSAATRYNTLPTCPALILKECDDCGTVARLTLCDGTEIAVRAGERDFKNAVAIHQNMVSLTYYDKDQPATPLWLKTTVFGSVLVLKIRGENLVELNGHETEWGYHPDKGVYKLEEKQ